MSRRAWRPAETPGTPPALTPSERPHHSHGRAHPADLLRNLRFSSEAACPRQHPGMQTTHARRVSLLGPVWPKRRNVKSSRKFILLDDLRFSALTLPRDGNARVAGDGFSIREAQNGAVGAGMVFTIRLFGQRAGLFLTRGQSRAVISPSRCRLAARTPRPIAPPATPGSRRTRHPRSPRSRRCTRGRPRRVPTPPARPGRLPRRTP